MRGPARRPGRGRAALGAVLAASLAVAGAGQAGPAGRAGAPGVRIVDAGGRLVGEATHLPNALQVTIAIAAGDRIGMVEATGHRFVRGTSDIWYELAGCAGEPLVASSVSSSLPESQQQLIPDSAIGPGNVLYLASGDFRVVATRSFWSTVALPPACQDVPQTNRPVFDAGELIDLDTFSFPLGAR